MDTPRCNNEERTKSGIAETPKTWRTRIKGLEPGVARMMCTQQVIGSLHGACRELIDNALDAGATTVDIRTKDSGLSRLEVIDNGSGINPEDYDQLCKPHRTSKLSNMNDLTSLTTFGFRGEALNALASMGRVTVKTRRACDRSATQMVFDENGCMMEQKGVVGRVGTTITVENLFDPKRSHNLAIRRSELERNINTDFRKLVRTVQAFAFGHPNVRFVLRNEPSDGQELHFLHTQRKVKRDPAPHVATTGGASTKLRDVITMVLGSKRDIGDLLEIREAMPDHETMQLYDKSKQGDEPEEEDELGEREMVLESIRFSGYVSACTALQGRSSPDWQFFYVNKREVDYPKMSRIAKEVYSRWNRDKYPMLILYVQVDPGMFDVNVTPEKRKVIFKHESLLLAKLHASLQHTFESAQGAPTNVANRSISLQLSSSCSRLALFGDVMAVSSKRKKLRTEVEGSSSQQDHPSIDVVKKDEKKEEQNMELTLVRDDDDDAVFGEEGGCLVNQLRRQSRSQFSSSDGSSTIIDFDHDASSAQRTGTPSRKRVRTSSKSNVVSERAVITDRLANFAHPHFVTATSMLGAATASEKEPVSTASQLRRQDMGGVFFDRIVRQKSIGETLQKLIENDTPQLAAAGDGGRQKDHALISRWEAMDNFDNLEELAQLTKEEGFSDNSSSSNGDDDNSSSDAKEWEEKEFPADGIHRPEETVIVDMDQLEASLFNDNSGGERDEPGGEEFSDANSGVVFKESEDVRMARAGSYDVDIDANGGVTLGDRELEQLAAMLRAEDFAEMEVVGQFNRSLIFARHGNELFAIDQHAADEKFLFEKYQREKEMLAQECTQPALISLDPVQKQVLSDNLIVLARNGFKFKLEPGDGGGSEMVWMTHTPGNPFTMDDLAEILAALQDHPGLMYRPEKARKKLASQACHDAVKFNTKIDEEQMRSIVSNMGEMDQPWNCPHGRPTIRHLGTMCRQVLDDEDGDDEERDGVYIGDKENANPRSD